MIEEPFEINITKEPQYEVEEGTILGRIMVGFFFGLCFDMVVLLIIAAVVYVCVVRP